MMTAKEAREILGQLTVTPKQLKGSEEYMKEKMDTAIKSKQYQKQGGVMFKFCDGAVAWISIWGKTLNLTERGETMYCGEDTRRCAETLCKMGIAHKIYGNEFLGCV